MDYSHESVSGMGTPLFVSSLPKYVGVRHHTLGLSNLKRDALMFDQIAIPGLTQLLASTNHAELELLRAHGVVFEPTLMNDKRLSFARRKASEVWLRETIIPDDARLDEISRWPKDWQAEFSDQIHEFAGWNNVEIAVASHLLRCNTSVHAIPLFNGPRYHSDIRSSSIKRAEEHVAVDVVLSAMPVLGDETPWEQVLDFRLDSENKRLIASLRAWLSDLAHGNFSSHEIAARCEDLLQKRKAFLELSHRKLVTTRLEVILTTTAEVLENLLRLRFSKVLGTLLAVQKADIALREAELLGPGPEVAYILAAREHFPNNARFD